MRAVFYDSYGEAVLRFGELPDPKLGPGEVLIEVKAAGVNPVDWKVMAGGLDAIMYVLFPVIPGWDVAGVVAAVGMDTPEFAVGDEVMAYARKDFIHGGTFAQYVTVPARAIARRPAVLSWDQAGALPLAGLTAHRSLERLGLKPDDTLLVYGAAGGVGSVAVQLARHLGARVIGTASPRNHDYVASLGAEPVAYGDGLAERVRSLAPGGVSAVADFVGGQLATTLEVLAPGGRQISTVDGNVIQHGGQLVWVRPDAAALSYLGDLADQGALTVEIEAAFALEDTARAFDASRTGHTRGKLVIRP